MFFTNYVQNINVNFTLPGCIKDLGHFSLPNFQSLNPFFNSFSNYTTPHWLQYNAQSPNSYTFFDNYNSFKPQNDFFTNTNNIYSFHNSIQSNPLKINLDEFTYRTNQTSSSKESTTGTRSSTSTYRSYGSLQEKYYKTALNFVGKINTDKDGNARFSNNRNNQWCADFASTLAYETFGNKLPAGFPDARKYGVSTMSIKAWGEKHNRYLKLPSTDTAKYIAENVKPGDIMIISRGEGKGHTAIVTKVHSDGTFDTVEGNIGGTTQNGGGKVGKKTRKPNTYQSKGATLIGFVQMGDIA